MNYLYRLLLIIVLIIAYYNYAKQYIMRCAAPLTRLTGLTTWFPASDIHGAIELALIAISHVLFCLCLILLLPIRINTNTVTLNTAPIYLLYGILLGIGCMGVSSLVCTFIMQLLQTFKLVKQTDLISWLTISRGGWIKHHLQSMELFPIYLSLTILTMQVGSEEMIFRAILLDYFKPFGNGVALMTATSLFVLMQAFLMNRWQGALFPMIGALVMGLVHSLLYQQTALIWPLIVAHVSFFLFSVL